MSKFKSALDNYFKISENGSSFKTEIVGGLTTFMAMAYILVVNPSIIAGPAGVASETIYIATALGAIVGTLMMALYAKLPFAQAPGMGLNAFFAFTVIGTVVGSGGGMTYSNALMVVLISGIVFLILTLVGIREKIVEAIPNSVKIAIPAGIGLFIAFVGMQNAKLVIGNASTLVAFGPLNFLKAPFAVVFPLLVVLITFLAIAIMSKLKVKGAILWGILGGAALHYIMGYCGGYVMLDNAEQVGEVAKFFGTTPDELVDYLFANGYSHILDPKVAIGSIANPFTAFATWGKEGVGQVFVSGWKGLFTSATWASDLMTIISVVIAFAMVDMFDTIGTLLGTARKANMLDENGKLPNMGKALLADSVATVTGAVFGTSTVTTFVESSAGVNEGAKTGFAALITAICFFIAMFITPLAKVIPTTATAAALIYVGVLMIGGVRDINFKDVAVAVPAFLTIAMMAFTYNISYGIALGLISHVIIKLIVAAVYAIKYACIKDKSKAVILTDDDEEESEENVKISLLDKAKATVKEIHIITAILVVLFLIYFFFVH